MQKITKIVTDDEKMFDSYTEAKKYLDIAYGKQLTRIAVKLLNITKYDVMCEFLDENLDCFQELINLKNELNEKEEIETEE